jgi:hypothetical protein
MMAEEATFDFFQLFDAIINSSASTTEKLLALVIGRHIGRGGQAAYPSRARLIELASCSLNSFKRSQAALRVFFEAEERRGKATKYAPKPSVSTSEIEAAIATMRAEGGPKLRPTSQATRTQDEAKGGPKLAPASPGVQQSRAQIEATNGPTVRPQKDSLKEEKKIPPVSPPAGGQSQNGQQALFPETLPVAASKAVRRGRGDRTLLPEDWILPATWRDEAKAKFNATDNQLDRQADRFKRYWLSPDSPNRLKADWKGTWINWVDRAQSRKELGPASPQGMNGAHGDGFRRSIVVNGETLYV